VPYLRDNASPDGLADALLVFLHEGDILFGLAGIERRASAPPFSEAEKALAEELGPFIIAGARAQIQYDELAREAAALRALGKVGGTVCVIDRDRKKVVWAVDRERGIEWDEDVAPIEDLLVGAAERYLHASALEQAIPTPPRLPLGTVVNVVRLDGEPLFGAAKCAAVRIERPMRPTPIEGLSRREREIARLLVAGYSGVNVAAISGLSENTVRTYVRRLYAKLEVSNRADLVRKLMSPETEDGPGPSSLRPPPDSSLVAGDDTLD
jgi:DNA-binding CsgD family transcriptional regulator